MNLRFSAVLARLAAVSLFASVPALSGCGAVYYSVSVSSAASRVEEAKAEGAERYAPYEYYYAKENLQQAQVESADASYSDAAEYAEVAEEYATKAIQLAHSARQGGGP